MSRDDEKKAAARKSLDYVRNGDVVGLGTGSTASHAITLLAERVREGLDIRGLPTSKRSGELAASLGIPLVTFDECDGIDVTIDGADQITPSFQLIKGHGGALLREKIVACASRTVVIIADASKQVEVLGNFPLPVEVATFAQALLARRIATCGAFTVLRRDEAGRPFVTDGGHHILDCSFGPITDPAALAADLDRMPGVIEHGLFLDLADVVIIGRGAEVLELNRPNPRCRVYG